jgi:hypothetical protein
MAQWRGIPRALPRGANSNKEDGKQTTVPFEVAVYWFGKERSASDGQEYSNFCPLSYKRQKR